MSLREISFSCFVHIRSVLCRVIHMLPNCMLLIIRLEDCCLRKILLKWFSLKFCVGLTSKELMKDNVALHQRCISALKGIFYMSMNNMDKLLPILINQILIKISLVKIIQIPISLNNLINHHNNLMFLIHNLLVLKQFGKSFLEYKMIRFIKELLNF